MGIFDKQSVLKPKTMATVAERRFDDAQALVNTKLNKHANGAAYLTGFVIEILLKALLVRKHPQIARKRQHEIIESERPFWMLIWRQHDLEAMLTELPNLEAAIKKHDETSGTKNLENLRKLCAQWTIYVRYSSDSIDWKQAERVLEMTRSLKELLKEQLT